MYFAAGADRSHRPIWNGDQAVNEDDGQYLLTRRSSLRCGALGAAAFVLLDGAAVAAARTIRPLPRVRLLTKGWKRRRFEPHIGTKVKFRAAGAPAVRVHLAGVEDLLGPSVKHLAGAQNAYVLRFRGPRSLRVAQGTVGIRHPRFGVIRLFVTPSTTTATTQDYVAIVNRHVPKRTRR
jgi:hypothetical protein